MSDNINPTQPQKIGEAMISKNLIKQLYDPQFHTAQKIIKIMLKQLPEGKVEGAYDAESERWESTLKRCYRYMFYQKNYRHHRENPEVLREYARRKLQTIFNAMQIAKILGYSGKVSFGRTLQKSFIIYTVQQKFLQPYQTLKMVER